ncbi:hypothetical protein IC006_1092 [Sulfuracidifex tepidarius]|uniref:Uncharacterized protein n=1 Tax=Sulfuracidifex tepidarius TaxID=1294262 RepID=A0A510DUE8_9CREN|nr:hypothetical protein [Sulfuracidifex tepidarius]BBG23797.1 hypothetical protein IC006_1092 [Sulfuracidifex tepidarius]BBG26552.1 hypothetical protein IC007_1067 [Sulfuracidifex tepidarius]
MSLSALHNVTSQFQHLLQNVNSEPISYVLISIGIALIIALIAGMSIYGMFKLIRAVPQMTTKQFLVFLIGVAVFILALGVFLP